MTNVRVDFPFLMEDRDRHGNVRVYVRRGGIKIRIREPKGSPGFARAYAEAVYVLNHPVGRHPIGTKARLALALLLFTGARRGDVVTFGRQHVKDGTLRYVPRKTRYKRMTPSEKPVVAPLAEIINESPTGDLTFLVTDYGKPFTAAGFGGWFRERCDEAGLPHCTAHGLKKAGATIAAENGATDRELMAMFDWSAAAQANVYTAAANRKKLAAKGSRLIVGTFAPPEGKVPHREENF